MSDKTLEIRYMVKWVPLGRRDEVIGNRFTSLERAEAFYNEKASLNQKQKPEIWIETRERIK